MRPQWLKCAEKVDVKVIRKGSIMRTISIDDVNARMSELLAAVEQGKHLVITRSGVAVAKLMPAAPPAAHRAGVGTQRQRVVGVFEELQRLRSGKQLNTPLHEVIKLGRD